MSKQRAKETEVQILPPVQKKESKVSRNVSAEGDTLLAAKDKLSQKKTKPSSKPITAQGKKVSEPTPPNPTPSSKPIAAKGKKISEPTSPPNPKPSSKPIAAQGKKVSEPTPPPNPKPSSKPIDAKGKKISEPTSPPNPKPSSKPITAQGKKVSEPTPPPNPKPSSKPIAAKGKKISEPTPPPNAEPNPKSIAAKGKKISEPTTPNQKPTSKPTTVKGEKTSKPLQPPSPEPHSKPIAAKEKKTSKPTPQNPEPYSKPIIAKGEKTSKPTPPPNPEPSPKLIATKGEKISEPTSPNPPELNLKSTAKEMNISEATPPRPTSPTNEGIKKKKKRVSVPLHDAASKLAGSSAAQSFLSVFSVNRSGKELHERPRSASDITYLGRPLPDQPSVSDKLQGEQDMKVFVRTGDAVSLSSITNPQFNSKQTAAEENVYEPIPPNPEPNPNPIAARRENIYEPTPQPNPEPNSNPIAAKEENIYMPMLPDSGPNLKPTAAKERKMCELTPPIIKTRESGNEGIKGKLKKVSEPLFKSANKLAGCSATQSFLSVFSANRSGKELHERPVSSSDITCLGSPLPDRPWVSDKLQVEQDTKVFVRTGEAVSLSSIANSANVQLPQLFVAESNYEGPPVLDKGQVIMVVKIKTTAQVHGTYSNGKEMTLSSTSSPKLSPLGEGVIVSQSLSAKDLFLHKALPPVVAVAKQFTMSAENLVTAGTILFLQQEQPTGTNKGNKKLQPALLARDLGGHKFKITTNCTGMFSTHPRDTALVVQEVIKHCQLPLKVCVSDSKEEVTLESVTQQQVLVAYPFNAADQQSECAVFELPTEGNLQLVRVVVQIKDMEIGIQPCDAEDERGLYESIYWNDGEQPQQTTPTENLSLPSTTQRDSVISTVSLDLSSTKSSPLGSPPLYGALAIGTSNEYYEKKAAENITYLRSLQLDEVIELLEAMQLEEYIESFKREKIDGEVLSSLTEEDLLRELNIQKRLHRVRLVKVIEGIYSAREILSQLYI